MRIGAMTYWLAEQLLNASMRGTAYTTPTDVYVALYTADPTKAGLGTEVTGGAYERLKGTFTAPAQVTDTTVTPNVTYTVIKNTADLIFPKATAGWGTVSHVAIFDDETAGNMLFQGPLENPKAVDEDDLMVFLAGDLVLGIN